MKTTVLSNPSSSPVTNYPIEEAEIGYDGEIKINEDGSYKRTGKTLEWSLPAGETLEFPSYVADYLKSIYGFLEVKSTREVPIDTTVQSEAPSGGLICRGCKQTFKSPKALGLHMAHAHPELL